MKNITTALKLMLITLQLVVIGSCNSNAQNSTIPVDEFEKGITQKDIQLLDVRTAEEFQSGHLQNALQANWNNPTEFQERVAALDKTKPVYIYCLSGGRSNAAMNWLGEHGFSKVYNMKGGVNAWKQANKAVQGSSNVPQITMQEYLNQIPKDKTVLVDIGAEWCPPCKKMKPIVETLEKEKYTIVKIDGGAQTELCKQLNVTAFPTFIVYKNGVEVTRKTGALDIAVLRDMLK
jgi:rhodanese-related sulfurtransferase